MKFSLKFREQVRKPGLSLIIKIQWNFCSYYKYLEWDLWCRHIMVVSYMVVNFFSVIIYIKMWKKIILRILAALYRCFQEKYKSLKNCYVALHFLKDGNITLISSSVFIFIETFQLKIGGYINPSIIWIISFWIKW